MCAVLLPPCVNPIAVKYISYHMVRSSWTLQTNTWSFELTIKFDLQITSICDASAGTTDIPTNAFYIYWGNKEIHCIFKTCYKISVSISKRSRLFHNFISFLYGIVFINHMLNLKVNWKQAITLVIPNGTVPVKYCWHTLLACFQVYYNRYLCMYKHIYCSFSHA
jgi:hypothetical protein